MYLKSRKSHTLTVAELPAHTHGRGTQDIVGSLAFHGGRVAGTQNGDSTVLCSASGAFYPDAEYPKKFAASTTQIYDETSSFHYAVLKASGNWWGTSESIGSDTAFNLLPPYIVSYCFRRLS